MILSKQGKINGERRVFQDKWTDQGSPVPMCLVCSETVAVTKEPETALFMGRPLFI